MGLYKLCEHEGRARDRCDHVWWGAFQHRGKLYRVSLSRWTNRNISSKAQAQTALEALRAAVREGRFDPRGIDPPKTVGKPLSFRALAAAYKQRHVQAKGLSLAETIDYRLKPLVAYFGDRNVCDIRTADVEDFIAELKQPRIVNGRERVLAPASINRTVTLLRGMLNWAVAREFIEQTPFKRGNETLIRPELEDNKRQRRVSEEEESKLLEAAPPLLRPMIVFALDTGGRRGEMLAVEWGDIDFERKTIRFRGQTTKSGRTRFLPIATKRLRAALKSLRLDADGEKKPDHAPVFSHQTGERVGSIRTAWMVTVLKAHGIKPRWKRDGAGRNLSKESRAELQTIGLHWHDMRHEFASRLVERGVPLAQVRDLLGHASVKTTERYDNQRMEALQAAAARLETGKTFDAGKHETDEVSTFLQVSEEDWPQDSGDLDYELLETIEAT